MIMLMNQFMDQNIGDNDVLLGENSLPPLFRLYHGLAQVCNNTEREEIEYMSSTHTHTPKAGTCRDFARSQLD